MGTTISTARLGPRQHAEETLSNEAEDMNRGQELEICMPCEGVQILSLG